MLVDGWPLSSGNAKEQYKFMLSKIIHLDQSGRST